MKFTKMQGCGNDYVYVNCFSEQVQDPSTLAKRIADRHYGVGGDGLILIEPSDRADAYMHMFNLDGSEGNMCGNGIRCVAKFIYDHGIIPADRTEAVIDTKSGLKNIKLYTEHGVMTRATVDMGVAKLTSELPEDITVHGMHLHFIGIDVGNPHAVYFLSDNPELRVSKVSDLDFLLYGHDFGNADAQTKKEIKKARREAVKEYLSGKIQIASDRREQLEKQMQQFVGVNVEQAITDMVSSLNATEQSISAALDKSKSLLGEIMKGEKRLAQCNVLLSRYEYLRSQYKADIQRLSFIVEGEQETKKLPTVSTCPFCEGKIVHRKKATYVDASKAELTRIIAQLEGLDTAEKNVQLEKEEIEALLEKLRQERDDIDRLIKDELKPKSAELESSINALKAYVRLSEEMRVVAAYAQDWETDIDNYDAAEETETPLVYHPKDYFDSEFQTGMTENAESILTECRYHNFTAARFDIPTFDIEVNGESKSSSHGKGYRSYLNTVVALMFRKFFMEHAVYNPGLLIIDTPLHGLDEEVSEDAPESMRAGLFTYFMNHQEGQLIIIENLDHIPNLDYESSGANVITFTKRRGDGSRYGFLNEVY